MSATLRRRPGIPIQFHPTHEVLRPYPDVLRATAAGFDLLVEFDRSVLPQRTVAAFFENLLLGTLFGFLPELFNLVSEYSHDESCLLSKGRRYAGSR